MSQSPHDYEHSGDAPLFRFSRGTAGDYVPHGLGTCDNLKGGIEALS